MPGNAEPLRLVAQGDGELGRSAGLHIDHPRTADDFAGQGAVALDDDGELGGGIGRTQPHRHVLAQTGYRMEQAEPLVAVGQSIVAAHDRRRVVRTDRPDQVVCAVLAVRIDFACGNALAQGTFVGTLGHFCLLPTRALVWVNPRLAGTRR